MSGSVSGRYRMKAPCESCPFRVSVKPYLTPGRALEIAESILQGADFPCHKTTRETDPDEDGGGDLEDWPGAKVCAGSMGTQENEGRPNQMLRIAGRIGLYEPGRIDTSDLYPSLREWVASYAAEPVDDDVDHCAVAGPECEDPIGWGFGGSVLENPEPGSSTAECEACGNVMCDACADPELPGCCIYCAEENV